MKENKIESQSKSRLTKNTIDTILIFAIITVGIIIKPVLLFLLAVPVIAWLVCVVTGNNCWMCLDTQIILIKISLFIVACTCGIIILLHFFDMVDKLVN